MSQQAIVRPPDQYVDIERLREELDDGEKKKQCCRCGEERSLKDFNSSTKSRDGLLPACKHCQSTYHKAYYQKNKTRIKKRQRNYWLEHKEDARERQRDLRRRYPERQKVYDKRCRAKHRDNRNRLQRERVQAAKLEFFSMYGDKCSLCDITEPELLSLDHVQGGGCQELKNRISYQIYKDATKSGVPDYTKYRVLCRNHNFALGHPRKPYEGIQSRAARSIRRLIDSTIAAYGNKCACCGETLRECLQLDHVAGGGKKHMDSKGQLAGYRDARDRNYPPDYQVLCANCNWSKYIGDGVCIHKRPQ